jgi:hypothetical protein
VTLQEVRQDYPPTISFHDLAATHVMRPIVAFNKDVRENRFDDRPWLVFIENHYSVHGTQSRENSGTIALVIDRPAGSFISPHRGIAVQPDNQGVALRARKLQILDVAAMEDIEASVGKDKFAAIGIESVTQLSRSVRGKYFAVHHDSPFIFRRSASGFLITVSMSGSSDLWKHL